MVVLVNLIRIPRLVNPDGDEIYFYWDFGDGSNSGWLGPYSSGATVSTSHTWDEKGDYEIKVRSKDPRGALSEWSDPLPITMPRVKVVNPLFDLLELLFERFPFLELWFQHSFNWM